MTTGRCPTCNHTLDLNQGGFLPPHSVLRTVRGTVTHCPGSGERPS